MKPVLDGNEGWVLAPCLIDYATRGPYDTTVTNEINVTCVPGSTGKNSSGKPDAPCLSVASHPSAAVVVTCSFGGIQLYVVNSDVSFNENT